MQRVREQEQAEQAAVAIALKEAENNLQKKDEQLKLMQDQLDDVTASSKEEIQVNCMCVQLIFSGLRQRSQISPTSSSNGTHKSVRLFLLRPCGANMLAQLETTAERAGTDCPAGGVFAVILADSLPRL